MNSEMDLLSLLESDKIVKIMWLSPKIDFARFDILFRVKLRYYNFVFFFFFLIQSYGCIVHEKDNIVFDSQSIQPHD